MTQSLELNGAPRAPKIRRLNRLPVIAAIALVVLFFGVILYGLLSRGLTFRADRGVDGAGGSASAFADQMKRGVPDGIIDDPTPAPLIAPAPAALPERAAANPFASTPAPSATRSAPEVETDEALRIRVEREQREQLLRWR